MTYQQAYAMADTLVTIDNKPRFVVTDNGQERGSDNYEVVERAELGGRAPIVRIDYDGSGGIIQTRGHHAMQEGNR